MYLMLCTPPSSLEICSNVGTLDPSSVLMTGRSVPLLAILQIDVSFSCVCPVIDHEFRHNIVKVAVDPQTTLTML